MPPVEQYRTEYVVLTPPSWTTNWVVISAPAGTMTMLDGAPTMGCAMESSGMLGGMAYESRRCPLTTGVHKMEGPAPFGIVTYGYGSAGSYAVAGGAPLGPAVAEQAVGQQAEVYRPAGGHVGVDALGAKPGPGEADLVAAGGQVGIDGAGRGGADDGAGAAGALELQGDVGQGGVVFVADVSNQHGEAPRW